MLCLKEKKDKIAIVVVGYNRIRPLQRLLESLERATYYSNDVPLVISIDASGMQELYNYVEEFQWSHGPKFTNIEKERLGLRKHILQCGDLTKYFKAIILLEDDIYVSEYFYDYVNKVVNFYYEDDRIGGFSLYHNEMIAGIPRIYMQDGSDSFLVQTPTSWGEGWTDIQWSKFREWYDKGVDETLKHIDIPSNVKQWKNAWSKFYMAYLVETDRYFVFPSISLTTCFCDPGTHSGGLSTNVCMGQVNLLSGEKNYYFKSFDKMTRYDIYGSNIEIYKWIGLKKEDLCIDLYGNNDNQKRARYLLSPITYGYKILKSYALSLRPIELNIKDNIEGNELFLYDTHEIICTKKIKKRLPLSFVNYFIRNFNKSLLNRFVIVNYQNIIRNKFLSLFGLGK